MDQETCEYYLRLAYSKALPVTVFSRLLKNYGSVQALINLPRLTLQELGFEDDQIDSLLNISEKRDPSRPVEAAIEWSNGVDNHLLCYESEQYPPLLRETDSAPPLLFARGSLNILSERLLAMVGSRSASNYGKRNAYWIAREISRAGLHICSGLASGIDTQAHKGALDGGGKTIAVVGTGIDRVYPARNAGLVEEIVENGVLLSEFPLGTPPYPSNFPRRNRIISGLSEGTLVVEGNIKSGSLITARLAMEQNRDVFALPGPVGSTGSRGCHHLIKQGAKLVEEPADILEELGFGHTETLGQNVEKRLEGGNAEMLSKREASVLKAIEGEGCLFESILDESKLEIQELSTELIKLEAAGLIHQEGGRYFRSL